MKVIWHEVRGAGRMCFHVMNAFEEPNGDILVVGCCSPDLDLFSNKGDVGFRDVRLVEWRIHAGTRDCVTERRLSEVPCEFPRINDNYIGVPFRFGYAAVFSTRDDDGPVFTGILKYDRWTGETAIHEMSTGQYCGEPIFVPRRDAVGEDDGYLLFHVHDQDGPTSYVDILDARSFTQNITCRLKMPYRVPFGFHSLWVTADHSRTEVDA